MTSKLATVLLALLTSSFALAKGKLMITKDGVGPITIKTPFDEAAIRKILPGYQIKKTVRSSEGEEFPIIEVYEKSTLLFTITPADNNKKIFSIIVSHKDVKNNLGPKINDTYKDVYSSPNKAKCFPGMEEMAGTFTCQDLKEKNILYEFSGNSGEPDDVLPSMKKRLKFRITGIIWKPAVTKN